MRLCLRIFAASLQKYGSQEPHYFIRLMVVQAMVGHEHNSQGDAPVNVINTDSNRPTPHVGIRCFAVVLFGERGHDTDTVDCDTDESETPASTQMSRREAAIAARKPTDRWRDLPDPEHAHEQAKQFPLRPPFPQQEAHGRLVSQDEHLARIEDDQVKRKQVQKPQQRREASLGCVTKRDPPDLKTTQRQKHSQSKEKRQKQQQQQQRGGRQKDLEHQVERRDTGQQKQQQQQPRQQHQPRQWEQQQQRKTRHVERNPSAGKVAANKTLQE
ncbi:unnamed protein product [Rangifer tarandus platyrhynchus]|uniref:Uncharacterized protein n=1 Tax=Rangifer tarandus platyrhynchus TaxID=3082113 RepID=A0ABN8XP62_RANTA|nr:unnamed protein product [Rangifer tarandus platyrhynchus]